MGKLFIPKDSVAVKSDKHKTHGTSVEKLLAPGVRAQLEALRKGT